MNYWDLLRGYVIFALVKILQLFKHLYCYLGVITSININFIISLFVREISVLSPFLASLFSI